ncbi:MAG TPA: hypothetical protein VN229_16950, partial [Terriglobales bacterium]|nr:hypothetical protein [Terriglobales bacterium]
PENPRRPAVDWPPAEATSMPISARRSHDTACGQIRYTFVTSRHLSFATPDRCAILDKHQTPANAGRREISIGIPR